MSRQRILVVEDDPFIAMDIEAAMLDHLGDRAEIIVTDNLGDAHGVAEKQVDCALLDVDVIGGKTFDLARRFRQRGTPFAFVSGSLPSDLPSELAGAAFLRKPFRPRDIVGFVLSALPVSWTNRDDGEGEDGGGGPGGPPNGGMSGGSMPPPSMPPPSMPHGGGGASAAGPAHKASQD